MIDEKQRRLIGEVWNYPLVEAIFKRRSRRFGLGMRIEHGPNRFISDEKPIPLSELEEAILAVSSTGLSGILLADMPHTRKEEVKDARKWDGGCSTILEYTGRTWPSACGSHGTELFFTNDDGFYIFKLRGIRPEKMQYFGSEDESSGILELFRKHRVKISDGRLQFPRSLPTLLSFNLWNVNMPGTTLFMPVSDTTVELINGFMLMLDQGSYVVDDMNNGVPCGCEKWVKDGFLKGKVPVPLSLMEDAALSLTGACEPAFIAQNMQLVMQAMGLGGWTFGGFTPLIVMGGTPIAKGMGFRHVMGKQIKGRINMPNPVGIDGIFEAYCPPYYNSMADAVQAVIDEKWGKDGIYNPDGGQQTPYRDRREIDPRIPRITDEMVDATKAICTYIYETYGRFPSRIPAMVMLLWIQAHHLELRFYDRYYKEGAYTETQRDHMKKWHT